MTPGASMVPQTMKVAFLSLFMRGVIGRGVVIVPFLIRVHIEGDGMGVGYNTGYNIMYSIIDVHLYIDGSYFYISAQNDLDYLIK